MGENNLVSVVIPAYNEEKSIENCLRSLLVQSYQGIEIIIVDDGSSDQTTEIVERIVSQKPKAKIRLLKQGHNGPGNARNFGSKKAKGEILVFVDADMTFGKKFIEDLTLPIIKEESIGTFSKNELNANADNPWSVCWNLNRGWPKDRLIPQDYPDEAPVYRAILKKKFDSVGGFDTDGSYTDDWSLSRKLGQTSKAAEGAVYYHANPASVAEIWNQARWFGKNEFIVGTLRRKIKSLIIYNFSVSFLKAIYKSAKFRNGNFFFFKIIFDFAVWISTIKSLFGEAKYKI